MNARVVALLDAQDARHEAGREQWRNARRLHRDRFPYAIRTADPRRAWMGDLGEEQEEIELEPITAPIEVPTPEPSPA